MVFDARESLLLSSRDELSVFEKGCRRLAHRG
jgi:hypothetical protein